MTRRRFIAIVSLCVLALLGTVVLGTALFVTRTDYGREWMRSTIETQLARAVKGKVHLGQISGSLLTGVTIDSVELRDDQDSLLVATGEIRVKYDPRDLVDRRIHLQRVDVQRPNIVLRQNGDFSWNFKRMFKQSGPERPKGPERGFGDFVVLDSVHLRNAQMRLDDAVASRRLAARRQARQRRPGEHRAQGPRDPPHARRLLAELSLDRCVRRRVAHAHRRSGQHRPAVPRRHAARRRRACRRSGGAT
jgi:hypothetical protein